MKKLILIFITVIVCLYCTASYSQDNGIRGTVYDNNTKLPISGAIINLENNYKTTISNFNGEYSFSGLSEGLYKIRIEYIGYKSRIIEVSASKDDTFFHRTYLEEDALMISQIEVSSNTNYGDVSISSIDMKLRPVTTAQDLLRLVPGLFIAQHAGGGKAEQIFLRGFDIDHGTDINITVDGLPVNMTSHAHGQGYADLHFVIPETIERFDVYKGTYFSKFGDFGTSGSVVFNTKNSIEKSSALLEFGRFNSYRGLLMLNLLPENSHILADGIENLYLASEYTYSDGYFESKQKFSRFNLFAKYFGMLSRNAMLTFSGSTFSSHWNASGQIPSRAVENKVIGRYGAVDDMEGGNTFRTNANIILSNSLSRNSTISNQIFYSRYGFNLYSNFTFFLNDPLNGDMINQYEKRSIYGYKGILTLLNNSGKLNFNTEIGIGARIDDIDTIHLAKTQEREFVNYTASGEILQKNLYTYINENLEFSDLIINPGLRLDYFDFDFKDDLDNSNSGNKTAVKLSPKLNVFYNVSPKTQLFIKSGIGFHSNDARVVVAEKNENTLPSAIGYEAGTSFTLGNALINLSLWGLNLESELVYVGDEAVIEPSGKTNRLGIDFTGRYQFNSWLWSDLDVNYTKGKFTDEPEYADRIPLAPVFTSAGGFSFKFENGFSGRLGYRFLDDRPANEDNSVIAEGYFIMDAVLEFTTGKYAFGLTAENLLDNKNWKEAQFDTESRLEFEKDPVSELHFTPGTPFYVKGNFSIFF